MKERKKTRPAGRKRYSDEDRARVMVLLESNNGNIYKTHKESGISRATIAQWRDEWRVNGAPKEVEELAKRYAEGYALEAERVRDLALVKLEQELRKDKASVRDLVFAWGLLDDKITRARGLATKKVETEVHLPDIKELGQQLGTFLQAAIQAAQERRREINESTTEQAIRIALESGEKDD